MWSYFVFRLIVHSTMNSVRETKFVAILLFCGSETDKRYVFRLWCGELASLLVQVGCGEMPVWTAGHWFKGRHNIGTKVSFSYLIRFG